MSQQNCADLDGDSGGSDVSRGVTRGGKAKGANVGSWGTSSNHIAKALRDASQCTAQAVEKLQQAIHIIRAMEQTDTTVRSVKRKLRGQDEVIETLHKRVNLLEQKTWFPASTVVASHAVTTTLPVLSRSARPKGSPCTAMGDCPTPSPGPVPASASPSAASVDSLPPAECLAPHVTSLGKKLQKAAHDGRTQDVKKLLELGADPNFVDAGNWTALHRAAARAQSSIVVLLLKHDAEVDARDGCGFAPLHMAAYNDLSGRCVSLLIDAGAEIDLRDRSGRTSLHSAADGGNASAVLALLAAGASKTAKDDKGRTPFDMAKKDCVRKILAPYYDRINSVLGSTPSSKAKDNEQSLRDVFECGVERHCSKNLRSYDGVNFQLE